MHYNWRPLEALQLEALACTIIGGAITKARIPELPGKGKQIQWGLPLAGLRSPGLPKPSFWLLPGLDFPQSSSLQICPCPRLCVIMFCNISIDHQQLNIGP
jgi:hypothetical protein